MSTIGRPIRPISERFWEKVERRGPDECWPWHGTRNGNGYGQFWLDRRGRPAHQVAWELSHGRVFPVGMMACHTCDVPLCVNPAHLFVGNAKTNGLDSKAKGRTWHPIGDRHPMAKVTSEQVAQIRALAATGIPQRDIAPRFGITQSNVSRIVRRESWAA